MLELVKSKRSSLFEIVLAAFDLKFQGQYTIVAGTYIQNSKKICQRRIFLYFESLEIRYTHYFLLKFLKF